MPQVETAYCYPSSDVARKLDLPRGGYYVRVGIGLDAEVDAGFPTPEEAYDYAASTGFPFGRYSLNRDGSFGA